MNCNKYTWQPFHIRRWEKDKNAGGACNKLPTHYYYNILKILSLIFNHFFFFNISTNFFTIIFLNGSTLQDIGLRTFSALINDSKLQHYLNTALLKAQHAKNSCAFLLL